MRLTNLTTLSEHIILCITYTDQSMNLSALLTKTLVSSLVGSEDSLIGLERYFAASMPFNQRLLSRKKGISRATVTNQRLANTWPWERRG